MKNIYKFLLLIVVFIAFSFSSEAQYRSYRVQEMESIEHDKYGDPISKNNPSLPKKKPPTEVKPFEFDINFRNLNELFRLEAEKSAEAEKAYAKWLVNQRSVLLKEINKQLGKRHTNFNTAKNDFFRDYEKNKRRVESAASTESWKLSQKAKVLNEQQKPFTTELYLIKEWQKSKLWCNAYGSNNGDKICNFLSTTKVRGKVLGNIGTTSLNQLYNNSLNDFSSREFQSAQNQAWSTGIRRIINDHSLLNTMVNNRIKNFDNIRNTETQVYLMINYLSGYYSSQSPLVYQIKLPHPKYKIPSFWDGRTIVAIGKKRAPIVDERAAVFNPDYITNKFNGCVQQLQLGAQGISIGYCHKTKDNLILLREKVIQEHINEFVIPNFFLINEGKGKKIDPKKELKCFDKTKPAKLTIYIEQPKAGTRNLQSGVTGVGHVFVGIEQGGFTRVFGYYPNEDANDFTVGLGVSYDAILRDNSSHAYNVRASKQISAQELTEVIEEVENFNSTYDLNQYACADFGIEIGNLANMGVPNITYQQEYLGGLLSFSGRAPGGLGEDLIDSPFMQGRTVKRETGKAPKRKGNCN